MYIYINICIHIYMYIHTFPPHNPRRHTHFFLYLLCCIPIWNYISTWMRARIRLGKTHRFIHVTSYMCDMPRSFLWAYLCDMPRSNVCITCLVHMHDTLSTCIIATHLYARLHHREASLCTTYHLHNLDTYARVMSHIWTRHVTHMNASWHTHTRTAPDTFTHLSRMHLCTTHASIYQSPHDPFIRAITHPYVPQLSHICHDSSIYASSDTWSPTLTATHSLQHTLCNTLTATHSQQRTLQRRWMSHMYNVPLSKCRRMETLTRLKPTIQSPTLTLTLIPPLLCAPSRESKRVTLTFDYSRCRNPPPPLTHTCTSPHPVLSEPNPSIPERAHARVWEGVCVCVCVCLYVALSTRCVVEHEGERVAAEGQVRRAGRVDIAVVDVALLHVTLVHVAVCCSVL